MRSYRIMYTPLGHNLRIFTLREAHFVTGGIISEASYLNTFAQPDPQQTPHTALLMKPS